MRQRLLAGGRAEHDDPAAAPFDHRRQRRLAAQEDRVEIDRQHLLPLGQREVPQVLGRAGDTDHRRKDVDVAVLGERALHHLVDLLLVRHVGPEAQRAAARFPDLRAGGRVQLLGREQVADRQQRALGGEPPGHRLRVAARGAGYQRHLVLQASHGLPPCRFRSFQRVGYPRAAGLR